MGLFSNILGGLQNDSKGPADNPSSPKSTTTRNASACPSCGAVFEKPPKRKVKCPECDIEVYVRTAQKIFPSVLLTKDDALAADFFKDLGAEVEDYKKMKTKLKEKWGTEPNSYDVVWGLSNWLVTRPVPSDVYDKNAEIMYRGKTIAFSQALYQLKRGHNPQPYQENCNNYEVKLAAMRGFKKMNILTQCCDACNKHQGELHDTAELSKKPLLPFKDCTRYLDKGDKYSWCTCVYLTEPNSL